MPESLKKEVGNKIPVPPGPSRWKAVEKNSQIPRPENLKIQEHISGHLGTCIVSPLSADSMNSKASTSAISDDCQPVFSPIKAEREKCEFNRNLVLDYLHNSSAGKKRGKWECLENDPVLKGKWKIRCPVCEIFLDGTEKQFLEHCKGRRHAMKLERKLAVQFHPFSINYYQNK